ncbi:MAG: antibiotic biosynthesis monooxygenase [Chloroflexi bacterium]|nr:antibiotic biosynthesis monooxygenase [Chloroflexota bacterium]
MSQLMIVRRIIPQPGRVNEAIRWLKDKERVRRKAGQNVQLLARSLTDPAEYMFVQVWESREAYEQWKSGEERAALAKERQTLLAHEPILFYELV